MRVVVVVPAFAEGDHGDPPVVARIVPGVEAALAPQVRGGVDQPRGVPAEYDAHKNRPQHQRPPADGQTDQRHGDRRDPVIVVQPHIIRLPRQIRRVFRHGARVVVHGLTPDEPADVRPESAVVG